MASPKTEVEERKLGTELPMLVREFMVEMTPLAKRKKKAAADPAVPPKKGKKSADDPADLPDDDEDLNAGADADDADADERDNDTFNIAISSEYPVRQWFGREILDHSPAAVDLSRAELGLSFLDSHVSNQIIGIVENVAVGADKKLRGQVRFSRNAPAQAVKQDILDGIRRFISVGYTVNDYALTESSQDSGETYTATNWTPMEVSSVGVPADPTVGNNRRAGDHVYPVRVTRSESNTASKPKREVTVDPVTTIQESRTAAAEIIRLGKQHGIDHERVAKMVGDGLTVEQASREILSEVEKRGAKVVAQPAAETTDTIVLTANEQREYNIARAIMATCANIEASASSSGRGGKRENTLELEISTEIEKGHTRESHGGLFVPWSIRHMPSNPELEQRLAGALKTRAGLSSGTAGAGQELKFVEPGEFIQYLYNRMRVKQLGARTLSGLRDNVSYPKQTGRATGSWVGENPGTDVADSALALGAIASQPHTYQSSSSYSRQLLAQAVIDVDSLVREDLARDLALAIDTAAISGSGSSNQPAGILNTSGVQSYVVEADSGNGGVPVWDDIIKMEALLETVNADQLGNGGWLTTPSCKSKLKRTAKLGNTIGLPIWDDDEEIDGKPAFSTNQVAANTVKGTSGATLSTLIYGVFATLIIGMWGSGFELVVDPYRLKKQGMIELTTFMLADITPTYPVAFAVAADVITV